MASMNQGQTIRLRELMARDDGWGTDEGHDVYLKLVRLVEASPSTLVFRISLAGVRRTDASFPRESVMEVARRYRKKVGFCLVDADNRDLLDNWDAAALKKEQPMFVWRKEQWQLIGPQPSPGIASALQLAVKDERIRAADLADKLSLKIANASMKLKQLWEAGYLLRVEDSADSGGLEFTCSLIR